MGLKEIPLQFSIDSEEDIRVMVISFFSELGYGMKSCANINVMTSLPLNSGFLPIFPWRNLYPSA